MASFRPLCKYGSNCYRKNPAHFVEFSHSDEVETFTKRNSVELEIDKSNPKKVRNNDSTNNLDVAKSPEFELYYSSSSDNSVSPKHKIATIDSSVTDTETDLSIVQKPLIREDSFVDSAYQDSKSHTFMFTTVNGINPEFNEYPLAVSLEQILSQNFGDINALILFSYMVDIDWLLEQLPKSKLNIPILIVVKFDKGLLKSFQEQFLAFPNIKFFSPNLPIPYGTHHTKMLLIFYPDGMRVVITTANFIPVDWSQKTQGVWISPHFPMGESKVESLSPFQMDLIEYLQAYQAKVFDFSIEKILKHEMQNITVRLIASIPGYHKGSELQKWGHLKMKRVLQQIKSKEVKSDWPLIAQFSSIGSLGKSPEWLESEWKQSFTHSSSHTPLSIVFPTVENVRTSLEGYSAGKSIPYNSKTCKNQLYLNRYLHQWNSSRYGRSRASPHIKTYMRCSPDCSSLAWLLLTSANLSKAAWGTLQKDDSQFMIRSYELGVLFLPQDQVTPLESYPVSEPSDDISLYYARRDSVLIPIDLPLVDYQKTDEPWIVDFSYSKPDTHGRKYPYSIFSMSEDCLFSDPQPRDLRLIHFQRAAIKTFGELQNLTYIHDIDSFKSNQNVNPLATEITPGNPLLNQKLTFSSPIPKGLPHGNSMISTQISHQKPSEVSEFLKNRLGLREKMDESTESITRKFIANKKPNALETRYLSACDANSNQNPIQDPYSRMIMFYKYLIFHFGQKQVDMIKNFFTNYKQALGVRFRILDSKNHGYILTDEMRNICFQFTNNYNKDAISEIIDFVEETGRINYKCFLVSSANLPDKLLYGKDSRSTRLPVDRIMTTDQVIRQKREEFDKLIALCKSKNVILSKGKFERALLLPENKTMDDIMDHFTGISLTRPSSKPGYEYGGRNSSDSESEHGESNCIMTYLANRQDTAKKVNLSTGRITLRSKVDCWINFKDYLKITTFSRKPLNYYTRYRIPDCKRYLAEPNAFWTGSEDNQYSYLPNKPRSLNPTDVHFKRIGRQFTGPGNNDMKHGTSSWPINTAGYMQYGSIPDKQCAL
ncbi:Tyrosyl-DNA phosphodiesterase 1-like isoform X1 [Oopsacas minuta]|uniref:Tyrosyl-DNA phosphodiesterase 1-like isoform X1 n=1 Tax=Oopsacas minuta TaxID=111878 RepID=A0AAV7JUC8_9METZ|nr:Tyrosyl-DNA phosphodiesterase 1-like isoform X1 [Oopsacas minuta]